MSESTMTLSESIATGITLSATAGYVSPFTITPEGTIATAGTDGVYSALVASTLLNEGAVSAASYGVNFFEGGDIGNAGTAAQINGGKTGIVMANNAGVVLNAGTITGGTGYGVQLFSGGYIGNDGAGATISGYAGGAGLLAGTVYNNGMIYGHSGPGVYFYETGKVINAGPSAAMLGYTNGIDFHGAYSGPDAYAYVLNNGDILGYKYFGVFVRNTGYVNNIGSSAVIGGGEGGVGLGDGEVYNQGTIFTYGRDGVYIYQAGAVTNSGTDAVIFGGVAGVEVHGDAGNVANYSGKIFGTSIGVDLLVGGTIINSGTISGGFAAYLGGTGANRLIVDPGAVFYGAVGGSASASNAIELGTGAGSLGGIGGQFVDFGTIDFDAGAAWTLAGNSLGLASGETINGFAVGDTLDLTGFAATSSYMSNGELVLSDGSTETLDITGGFSLANFVITSDGNGGTDVAICYLRGTRILTSGGEKKIEDLRTGDAVVSRFGGWQRIKWIGRQSYGRRFIAKNRAKIPVCIKAGALGEGYPARDLYVSPGHSMLLGETLILARSLVNGVTITQELSEDLPEPIEYYQIELETHDCVLAEGAWSETFADGPGLRAQFHNAAEFWTLYPDAKPAAALALCAERPERGPALDAALRAVVARTGAGLRAGRLEGAIDIIGEDTVEGWAIDTAHAELPVLLEVLLGERLLGRLLACDPRGDLAAAGKGNGNCSFIYTLPEAIPADARHLLRVRRACDAAELNLTEDCQRRVA